MKNKKQRSTLRFFRAREARQSEPSLILCVAVVGLFATQFTNSALGANACDRQRLGISIRDNGAITLDTSHPSGISDYQSTARANIVDTADGKKAKTSYYSDVGTTEVWLDPRLLDAMDRLAKVYGYTYRVSEIAGGDHSSTSYHYAGTAFDVYIINGQSVSSSNPYWSGFNQRCRDMGAIESLGPGDAGHSTHVHNAWPTGDGVNVTPSGCPSVPDWRFDSNSQGWTVGWGTTPIVWHSDSTWPGIIYADQTGDDAFFYGPSINHLGGANDQVVVRIHIQSSSKSNHDMQLFWKTAGENYWDAAKSCSIVNYTLANDTWGVVTLNVGANPKWSNDFVTQIRLDVDNVKGATNPRWLIDYVAISHSTAAKY